MPHLPTTTYTIVPMGYSIYVLLKEGNMEHAYSHGALLERIKNLITQGLDASVEESALVDLEIQLNSPQRRQLQ